MTLLAARGIHVAYTGVPALRDVSMAIAPGEIVTLVGPNGSGKSTLVKALLGAVPLARGRVERRAGLRIGYVPQRLGVDRTLPLSVARFLSLPVRRGADEIAAALARAAIPDLARRQIADLSGGQFQRVLLARALLGAPDLLILDEPTQGLDPPGVAAFYRLVEDLRRETGAGVLLVSHDLHIVMRATDRVICLNGHVCCEGAPATVLAAPEYRALFGADTAGAFAVYRHDHDHAHGHDDGHDHDDGHGHDHGHDHDYGQHAGDGRGHGAGPRPAAARSPTAPDRGASPRGAA